MKKKQKQFRKILMKKKSTCKMQNFQSLLSFLLITIALLTAVSIYCYLPVSNRLDQCLDITAYNFKNALSPKYMDDIYSFPICPNIWTHRSTDSSFVPFYEKQSAKKSISYLGSKIWNDLNQDIKTCPSRNNFKHALKRCFFKS